MRFGQIVPLKLFSRQATELLKIFSFLCIQFITKFFCPQDADWLNCYCHTFFNLRGDVQAMVVVGGGWGWETMQEFEGWWRGVVRVMVIGQVDLVVCGQWKEGLSIAIGSRDPVVPAEITLLDWWLSTPIHAFDDPMLLQTWNTVSTRFIFHLSIFWIFSVYSYTDMKSILTNF